MKGELKREVGGLLEGEGLFERGWGGGDLIEDLQYTTYFFFSNSLKALFLSENLVS